MESREDGPPGGWLVLRQPGSRRLGLPVAHNRGGQHGPEGGFIVFNYGDSDSIGTSDHIAEVMFETFYDLREYWTQQ